MIKQFLLGLSIKQKRVMSQTVCGAFSESSVSLQSDYINWLLIIRAAREQSAEMNVSGVGLQSAVM